MAELAETIDAISYHPLPTLRRFHESPADLRCIVGPVGSGKTTAAAWEVFYYLPFQLAQDYGIKQTRWVILRNSYRELADTTQKTVLEWFSWGDFRAGDQRLTLKYPEYGIEIEALFRSCDSPEDIKKFKSLELTGYWIDESSEVKNQIKLMLKNRIGRYPQKCPVRFGIETTNPPDTESSTYTDFFQKPLTSHEGFKQPPRENEANLRAGYYDDLIQDYAHNPDWVSRYVMGKWGVTVQGKPVYNNFRSSIHVATNPIKHVGKTLYTGWDNSGNCPACVIIQVPTAGVIQTLREYHTERMGIVDFGDYVVADRNMRYPNAEFIEWGDPAGFARFSRSGGGLTSNAELLREVGVRLDPSDQNWEARREAVETQLGKLAGGEPAMLIDPTCTRLINGFLGGYSYPEMGTTGIYGQKPIKNKWSHIHDALQYVCVMLNKNVRIEKRNRVNRSERSGIQNWANKDRQQNQGYREYYA